MATRIEPIWVLDTSVVVAWFSPDETQHARAAEVRDAVRVDPRRYIVPHLLYSEVANVLARKWAYDADYVQTAIAYLIHLGFTTLALTDRALLRMAQWTCRGLGGYDATFVALAEDLGGRWLTADTRSAKIADEHAVTLLGWTRIQAR